MDNIQKIRALLPAAEVDAFLLTSEVMRRYATGFPASDGMVLITGSDAWFYTDSRYTEAAALAVTGARVLDVGGARYSEHINKLTERCGIRRLGFEDGRMTVAEHQRFAKQLQAELVPVSQHLEALRQVKEDWEIQRMIQAQRIAERALEDVLNTIRLGMTEKDVAAELTYRMLKYGAENMSFDPIVVSGPKSSMPHGVPEDVPLVEGFLTMDFGCIYQGYCSDMTRTVALGSVTEEMQAVYETVQKAQLTGIAAARAGVSGSQVDQTARDVIQAAGYGPYFGHSFGHGVGLEIHEQPNASPASKAPLPAGAVISAEPGIYLPGRFGVRIEDVLVIREGGCENITKAPKALVIL